MKGYLHTGITVIITLLLTAVFNHFFGQGSSLYKNSPTVQIIGNAIKVPLALPLSIPSKEETEYIKEIIDLFEKTKPENQFGVDYALNKAKEFLALRMDVAASPSETIVDEFRRSGTIDYTVILISNDTDAILSNISVVTTENDKIFETNSSKNKNYDLSINGNKAQIDSLTPGAQIYLVTTARKYFSINTINVLHDSALVAPIDVQVNSGTPLGYLVAFSNSGMLGGMVVFFLFAIGLVTIVVLIVALIASLFTPKKQESAPTAEKADVQ